MACALLYQAGISGGLASGSSKRWDTPRGRELEVTRIHCDARQQEMKSVTKSEQLDGKPIVFILLRRIGPNTPILGPLGPWDACGSLQLTKEAAMRCWFLRHKLMCADGPRNYARLRESPKPGWGTVPTSYRTRDATKSHLLATVHIHPPPLKGLHSSSDFVIQLIFPLTSFPLVASSLHFPS